MPTVSKFCTKCGGMLNQYNCCLDCDLKEHNRIIDEVLSPANQELASQRAYVIAWAATCRYLDELFEAEDGPSTDDVVLYLEELRRLHGDPNKPAPARTIDVKDPCK